MRILPRVNEAVNEEWISDKTRFIWDGLSTQRLDRPYVRKDGRLQPASWAEAFAAIKDAGVQGSTPRRSAPLPAISRRSRKCMRSKLLMARSARRIIDCRQDGAALDPSLGRASYLFNPTIEGIEAGRRDADRRRQPALRSVGSQCPHPQALARRQPADRRDRRRRRHALRLRTARRRHRNR